jgi:membrane-bound lytic murein transglycosylase A
MLKKFVIFIVLLAVLAGSWLLGSYLKPLFENHIVLQKLRFNDVAGWQQNDFIKSELAFEKTCEKVKQTPAPEIYEVAGKNFNLERLCTKFELSKNNCCFDFKKFIEQNTQIYRLRAITKSTGLFTGYYIPEIEASLTKTSQFKYAVYGLPQDEILRKQTRTQIENGGLENKNEARNLEILYVKDDILLFFAQIQGSFMAKLPNNEVKAIGYAGKNSQNYHAIGKYFVENGIFDKKEVSAERIIEWLRQNPEKKNEVLNLNPSYVYFKILDTMPQTTSGATVTTNATLAVDKKFIPLGTPIFLQTNLPDNSQFNQLMIAQDTGGAIKGAIRGDVFFGYGDDAFKNASHMNAEGKIYVVIPKD